MTNKELEELVVQLATRVDILEFIVQEELGIVYLEIPIPHQGDTSKN